MPVRGGRFVPHASPALRIPPLAASKRICSPPALVLAVNRQFPLTSQTHWLSAPSRSNMHPCLNVDEILRLLAHALVVLEAKATAVALACCCKSFEEPALDVLWEAQNRLGPLLKCFPRDVWEEEDGNFVSPLTALIFSTLNRLI